MLTKLHFKNWRSLRDVTISNLTPITVFIGANSSGKSNILDALHFLRNSNNAGIDVAIQNWGGIDKIRLLTASPQDNVELAITFDWVNSANISDKFIFNADKSGVSYDRKLSDGGVDLPDQSVERLPIYSRETRPQFSRRRELERYVDIYEEYRWQMLRENMTPATSMLSDSDQGDPYSIDQQAQNLPLMLDFMQLQAPETYASLQADLSWLLDHIEKMEMQRDEREMRMVINEKPLGGKEAPTISGGTSRLIAMLTAYYVLDLRLSEQLGPMRSPEQPGLIVIEEPDAAINPLLLEKLVELMRGYTEREGRPRQFILTTHNPRFIDYFKPEEVRVVQRDPDTGETSVDAISDSIKDIWLPKHSLGEAWTGRIIGGIPTE